MYLMRFSTKYIKVCMVTQKQLNIEHFIDFALYVP